MVTCLYSHSFFPAAAVSQFTGMCHRRHYLCRKELAVLAVKQYYQLDSRRLVMPSRGNASPAHLFPVGVCLLPQAACTHRWFVPPVPDDQMPLNQVAAQKQSTVRVD